MPEIRMHLQVIREDGMNLGYLTQRRQGQCWAVTKTRSEAGDWKKGSSVKHAATRYREFLSKKYPKGSCPEVLLVRTEKE